MKIFGTIRNSNNQDPVKGADIRFSIEGTEITLVISNEHGEYEYIAEQDYIGQTLDFAIQKDGFERKNISYEIDKDEIKADILLNKLEKGTKEKTRIFGTIQNSKKRDPVKNASITLSIESKQIAAITSDKKGDYEYTAEEDYTGQTLDYVILKEGYIKKNISYEIDRPTIKADILIDEIKIKIKGKICNETDNPLDNASISFSIGGSTIKLNSDKDGSFSFTVDQQFLNQTIGYEASKEGFKVKSGKLTLIEDLKCINLITSEPNGLNKKTWIKVAAVGIALVAIAIILLPNEDMPPELSIYPDSIDFDFVPGTGAQTFSIWNDGDGNLDWDVYSNRDWIMVSRDDGTDPGTVSVNVNSAGMYPGNYTGRITVKSNGGTETGNISLYIPEPEPTGGPTAEPTIETTAEPTIETTAKPTIEIPRIHYFRADPEHIDGLEGETTLSWEVTDATSVTIDGIGAVEISTGSIDRRISKTTTFTLRATNDAEVSDERDITVYVKPVDSPVINYFIANPDRISPGEKSTLQWDVSGVETITIDNGIGKMGGIANTDVFLNNTTIFILTAENDAGKDAKTVKVHVLNPKLTLYPDPFSFYFYNYDFYFTEPDNMTISISNSGDGNLRWTIHAEENWITIDPKKGVNDEIITIGITTEGLELGDYKGIIYIDSNGGTAKGEIFLNIYED
jgi:hypothetical protein